MKNFVIIPAGGMGLRFGGNIKKQFLTLKGKSLLHWALNAFVSTGLFERIVVSVPRDEIKNCWFDSEKVFFVEGGQTRAESVRKGFESLSIADDDIVLVHDAVRPLVSATLIKNLVTATHQKGAAIPVLTLTDTIKHVEETQVIKTVDRKNLVSVQTPQGFLGTHLRQLYKKNSFLDLAKYTDEAMGVEDLGVKVFTVPGEKYNIKVTTNEDLELAEFYANRNRL